MDLADKISPVEVLSHLRDMGYHNITPLQLKEFVTGIVYMQDISCFDVHFNLLTLDSNLLISLTDLKKLIVYDQLSSSSGSSSSLSTSSSSSSESDYFSSNETLSNSSGDSCRLFEIERIHLSEQQKHPERRYRNLNCQANSKLSSLESSSRFIIIFFCCSFLYPYAEFDPYVALCF